MKAVLTTLALLLFITNADAANFNCPLIGNATFTDRGVKWEGLYSGPLKDVMLLSINGKRGTIVYCQKAFVLVSAEVPRNCHFVKGTGDIKDITYTSNSKSFTCDLKANGKDLTNDRQCIVACD